jgi:hypothetical protein
MRCREASGLLSAALDDALGAADRDRLEQHLAACARCRSDRDAYAAMRTALRVSEPFAVDLVPALRARLAGEIDAPLGALVAAPGPRRGRARDRRHRTFVGVTAAAAAIALVVGIAVLRAEPNRVNVLTAPPAVPIQMRAPGGASLLLAWTTGGLPAGALARTRAIVGVEGVTQVLGTELRLTGEHDAAGRSRLHLGAGDVIPIDALAIDPASYARDLPRAAARLVRRLPRDGALLGATSARVRGIGVGGSLTFGSTTVRVTGIVADALVGAAEVVVRADSALPIRTPRFLLVAYRGDRGNVSDAITAALLDEPVRFRAPGETPYLRHGDSVLPQALVKARFGEFWYHVDARGSVSVDPAWTARNIVTITVPGVGRIECHRLVAAALRRALTRAHLTNTVVDGFDPQVISARLGLSRHMWGIGLSLQTTPDAQPRTIAAMAAAGFQSGGHWLNRSPDYYEWVGNA